MDLFNSCMSEILDKIKSEKEFVTCLGDYNISLLNAEMYEPTHEFTELMYSYSMFPCITKLTRLTTKTATLYSKTNIDKFKACVRDKDWSDVLSCNDPQSAYTAFHNDFTTVYDECFPLRTLKYGYKTRKPWLSEGLKKSIQRKNKLFYRKQKSKKPEDEFPL